ncbi:N-acetylglucosamine-6-sulfatase-like isoform X2 [Cimex lectularius]|uniref:Sulfatase N-terminal domain-containing protein n=1 Tax=Cimex lectularius TaxID=79782 RepID=A0A8I6TMH1_CIMLE|nr:N-acetylglucosamine-6-sulfatase-like isoform X2 [Cimex lectularius]
MKTCSIPCHYIEIKKPMKNTLELLSKNGATYKNAFTTTPICCPSRASLLTGLYQHNHQVKNNTLDGNCSSKEWQTHFEGNTFATYLKEIGYNTFYGGKYLNQYGHVKAGGPEHIPKGWDTWIGLVGNSKYYNYRLSINGKTKFMNNEYLTNVLEKYALNFLSNVNHSSPFLMMVAPPAPHAPFTPEPKYNGSFLNEKIPREPHFNYGHNQDKHWFMRMKPAPLPSDIIRDCDHKFSERWETLLSVDDLVKSIVDKLSDIGQLNNTYIFYTSDNGFHLGQFSMPWDKRQFYEFDIRIPFIVRGPGIDKNITVTKPTLLIDVAPTILNLAGLNGASMDGIPFLPIIKDSKQPSLNDDRSFLIEYQGERSLAQNVECPNLDVGVSECFKEVQCKCQDAANNTYNCIRSFGQNSDTVYCQFFDNENFEEAYDLLKDPYQLKNAVASIPEHEKLQLKYKLNYLKYCRHSQCNDMNFGMNPVTIINK